MARTLRIEFAGALYHITSRGDRQEEVYLGDDVFVEKRQRELETDKDLSEIPTSQRRLVPKSLPDYERHAASPSEYVDIHCSRVSRILNRGDSIPIFII